MKCHLLGRRKWQLTPVSLTREFHGQRSLVCCCPWGCTELDMKQLSMHACIGEGNGNPFQCSCLKNPRDSRAWWVAVYGVSQSRTQLKRLSSSSRHLLTYFFFLLHVTNSEFLYFLIFPHLCF